MKKNEYDAAEVVEIGEAQSVVLGDKVPQVDWDTSIQQFDFLYVP